jgi:transcriptional regulator with GAF, ATPase, and Fis domain
MIAAGRLLDAFVEMADTLVDHFDLIDFLHRMTDHTAAISGASSVGLLVGDEHGRLNYMAATSTGAEHLELYQLQTEEGPCLDCVRTQRPVIMTDLRQATDRWPSFAPLAVVEGFRSVHAFPMRLRNRVVGAMNVFGEGEEPLDAADARVIQALADVATIALLQQRALSAAETLTGQLQGALNSRILIEQAKGVVAASNGVTPRQAFEHMRGYARRHHVLLTDLAALVVNRELDPRAFAL